MNGPFPMYWSVNSTVINMNMVCKSKDATAMLNVLKKPLRRP